MAYLQKNRLGVIWLDTLHRIINEYPGSIIKEELEQGGYTKAISNFEQLCASTKDETLIYLMQGLWLIFHKDKNFSFKDYSPFSGEDMKVVVKLYINTLICVLIAESELSSMQVATNNGVLKLVYGTYIKSLTVHSISNWAELITQRHCE